jgi:hypothetical protein
MFASSLSSSSVNKPEKPSLNQTAANVCSRWLPVFSG